MAKKLVEGVDYEMVKMKNSNAMTRNIFTKSEKEARAAKAKAKPAAKPAAKAKTAPPKNPKGTAALKDQYTKYQSNTRMVSKAGNSVPRAVYSKK